MHEYHEGLPGYSPDQVWHDGCPECEGRGERLAVDALDTESFRKAWFRAERLRREGLPGASHAELPLLRLLGNVQVQLDRWTERGIM